MLDKMQKEWVDACAKLAADELRWDGDTVELPNGETLTLHVEPDQDTSIMDEQGEGVWCGRLEWAERRNSWDYTYRRPEWADGGAELLSVSGEQLWWRPLDDCLRDRTIRDAVRATVLELLEYGYSDVGVEYRGETAWIGGCDDVYPELVEGQAWEVLAEAVGRERARLVARIARREVVPV